MSKVWQWVLGILAVLVVVGLVAGAVLMWRNHVTWWGPAGIDGSFPDEPQAPVGPYGFGGYPRYHMYGWDSHMPMMYGNRSAVYPFGLGFLLVASLCRLLLPLGVLALIAYLFYQMGKRAGIASVVSAPSTPKPLPSRKVAGR